MAVAPPLFKHTEDAAKESLLLFLSLIGLLSIGDSRRGSVSGHDLGTHRNRRLRPNRRRRRGRGVGAAPPAFPPPHPRTAGVSPPPPRAAPPRVGRRALNTPSR